jgi:hypothetical protein
MNSFRVAIANRQPVLHTSSALSSQLTEIEHASFVRRKQESGAGRELGGSSPFPFPQMSWLERKGRMKGTRGEGSLSIDGDGRVLRCMQRYETGESAQATAVGRAETELGE